MEVNAGARPRALIVDDDPIQCRILGAVMKKLGIDAEMFSTSHEFINRLKSAKADFCLIDLNLESLGTGFTIIEAVRKVMGSEPVLIVISGNGDRSAIAHALEVGANDYLIKPLDRDVLIAKLSQYVMTEQIGDARVPLLPVPQGGTAATVELDYEVCEVDEFGLVLKGRHLPVKGLALPVEGPLMQEMTGDAKAVLLTVASTWVGEDGQYRVSAEFDASNDKLMNAVRRWISEKAVSE